MMHGRQRLMLNNDRTKIRAIQGHTLSTLEYDKLYERIISIPFFQNWRGWGGNTPNMVIVELKNEPTLMNWRRLGLLKPSVNARIHTMKAIVGTDELNHVATDVTMYAYVRIRDLFEYHPRIDMYITPNGRIVTPHGIPWSAVEIIRRNQDGNIIDKNTITAEPTPRAPAAKRVQSRDSMGRRFERPTSDLIPQTESPDRQIITKDGQLLWSGFHNMLERRVYARDGREQFRQLQILKGVFKTERCRYDANRDPNNRCRAGERCNFRHSVDTDEDISRMITPIRQKVFRELYDDKFALPDEILHEIGAISTQEYDIRQDKKEAFAARREEDIAARREHNRRIRPRRSMSPPISVNSNESRVNRSRTPTPPGANQGRVLALENIDDTNAERQRDNTSAGMAERSEEHSDTDIEDAAPIEAQDADINMEAIPEDESAPLLEADNLNVVATEPQADFCASDDAMDIDPEAETAAPETVVQIVATNTGVEVATSPQEGIVTA